MEKKPPQQRAQTGGDRNVKFSGESREERNNRRNREDGGERPPRNQGGELRRGPPGLVAVFSICENVCLWLKPFDIDNTDEREQRSSQLI